MRILCVQIQPSRIAGGGAEGLIASLRAAADGRSLHFVGEERGEDNGPYINVRLRAPDHVDGWFRLRTLYDESDAGRRLASSTIVACEGANGWDDYLLLHHFDPAERIDDVRSR